MLLRSLLIVATPYTNIHKRMYTYVYTYIQTYVVRYINIYSGLSSRFTARCSWQKGFIHKYVYTYTYVYIFRYIHMCIYIVGALLRMYRELQVTRKKNAVDATHVCLYMLYVCIYIYIYIYIGLLCRMYSAQWRLYGVATVSGLLRIIRLFCNISSLFKGSFAKET